MLSRPDPPPAQSGQAETQPEHRLKPPTGAPKTRVLVVEDKGDEAYVCKHLLKKEGMEILSAGTCKEGLRMARDEQPDLMVVDEILPDGDGHEFALKIKLLPELARVPVVGIGAVNTDPAPEGFAAYLAKPIRREKFCKTIRDLLGQSTRTQVKERRRRPLKLKS